MAALTHRANMRSAKTKMRALMERLRLAASNGAFPMPLAAVTTATVTGTFSPADIPGGGAAAPVLAEQTFPITTGSMQAGDVVAVVTPPTAMPAGVSAHYRYINPTTVGVAFRNTNGVGTNAVMPSGVWTVTVARWAGGMPADAPHFMVSALNAGTSLGANTQVVNPVTGPIRIRGAYKYEAGYDWAGSKFVSAAQNSTSSTGKSGSMMGADCMTDAPKIEVLTLGYGGALQVIVDGKIASVAPLTAPATFGPHRYLIDFTQGGTISNYARKWRKIRIEMTGLGYFGGFVVTLSDTIKPIQSPNPLVAVSLGDSFVEGSNPYHPIRPSVLARFDGFANRVGDVLGWDLNVVCGIGGTGYVNTNGVLKYEDRINDIISLAPDIVVVWGSVNDDTHKATVKAAVTAFHTRLAAALPNTLIVVFGVAASNNTANTGLAPLNTLIKEGVAAVRAPNIRFVDMLANPWVIGTGGGNSNGNANFYMDGTSHPTWDGHAFLTHKVSESILGIVREYELELQD